MIADILTAAYWLAIVQCVFTLEVAITLAVLGALSRRKPTPTKEQL